MAASKKEKRSLSIRLFTEINDAVGHSQAESLGYFTETLLAMA
jgi:hypothetical protein